MIERSFDPQTEIERAISGAYQAAIRANAKSGEPLEHYAKAQEWLARLCGLKAEVNLLGSDLYPQIRMEDAKVLALALIAFETKNPENIQRAESKLKRFDDPARKSVEESSLIHEARVLLIHTYLRVGKAYSGDPHWDKACKEVQLLPEKSPYLARALTSVFRAGRHFGSDQSAEEAAKQMLGDTKTSACNSGMINLGLFALIELADRLSISDAEVARTEGLISQVLPWVEDRSDVLSAEHKAEILARLYEATLNTDYAHRCHDLIMSPQLEHVEGIQLNLSMRMYKLGYRRLKKEALLRLLKKIVSSRCGCASYKAGHPPTAIECGVVEQGCAPKAWREACGLFESEKEVQQKFDGFCHLARVAKTMTDVPVFPPPSIVVP